MVEVKIMIPTYGNDGREFSAADNAAFEGELKRLFGGFSRLPNTIIGEWVDGESRVTYRDVNIAYLIAVDGLLAKSAQFAEAIALAKAHYGQLAIYVAYLGVSEIL